MMSGSRAACGRLAVLLAALLILFVVAPQSAQAHGAIDPVASSYLARVKAAPSGLTARVVDGDLRLWLRVPAGKRVVVFDYQGAPYLRFADGRVWANENSEMYYFNQTPPATPPLGLKRNAPERWIEVGSGTSYEWHDGRLHAFALQAVAPGASYVGPWRIPVSVDGRLSALSGTLWYRGGPSIVWFWPIVVLVLLVLAAWRLYDSRVDALAARAVAGLTLVGVMLAAIGRGFHGRPGISGVDLVEFAFVAALVVWLGWRVLRGRAGSFTFLVVAAVGLWEGIALIPTLLNGYVLLAMPTFLGRVATVSCLGGAIALALPTVRLLTTEEQGEERELPASDAVGVST